VNVPEALRQTIQTVHQQLPDKEDDDAHHDGYSILGVAAKEHIEELFAKHTGKQQRQFDEFRSHLLTEQSNLIAKVRAEILGTHNEGPENHVYEERLSAMEDSVKGFQAQIQSLQEQTQAPQEDVLVKLRAVEASMKLVQINILSPLEDTRHIKARQYCRGQLEVCAHKYPVSTG